MRLKSIGISNFKAFGKEFQTIPIKPITLVFGPNSAGKSSLLHSLLWLNHVLQTGDCNVTAPQASLGQINLEGFLQIRHHNQPGTVNFSLLFTCDLPPCGTEKGDEPTVSSIEIKLNYGLINHANAEPAYGLTGCRLLLDGSVFVSFTMHRVLELNLTHPIFAKTVATFVMESKATDKWIRSFLSKMVNDDVFEIRTSNGLPVSLDYHFFMFGMTPYSRKLVSFERVEEFTKEVSLIASKVFALLGEAVAPSIGKLTYLPPVRELPPRNFDPSKRKEQAWREIARNPELVNQLNQWLSDDKMLGTGYRLENRAFLPTNSIQKRSPSLLRRELWNLLTNTNFADDAAFFIDDAKNEFRKMDKTLYASEHPELYNAILENELDFVNNGDGYYNDFTPEQRLDEAKSIIDSRIHDGDVYDDMWDYYLQHFQPLIGFLDEKWNIEEATKRLSSAIENECTDRKYELSLVQNGSETRLALQDVGFGISQILPVLIHSFASKNQLIAIEQPELHLHPRLQAEIGDVFIESALGENKNTFLLETHSEHLILRILRRIRETTEGEMADWPEALRKACPNGIRPEDVAVLYVQPGKDGSEVIELPVTPDGDFTRPWPSGFFTERFKELYSKPK